MIMKVIRASVSGEEMTRRAQAAKALAGSRQRCRQITMPSSTPCLPRRRASIACATSACFHGDTMASGIVRRAILAAGARLVAEGRAQDPEDLVDASPDEIVALLEKTARSFRRRTCRSARAGAVETPITAAPANLGFEPSPPPPPEWLPPDAARLQRITSLILSLIFDVRKARRRPEPGIGNRGSGSRRC
jgi:pyruvate,water dikinase